MIPISAAFRAELNERIRKRGYAYARLFFSDGTTSDIPEYFIKRVEFNNAGDPLARRLPLEECTISVLDYDRIWDAGNPDGLYDKTNGTVRLAVRIGISTGNTIEWTTWATYFADKQPAWNNYVATFHFVRTLSVMVKPYRGLSNYTTNLGLAAEDICRLCAQNSPQPIADFVRTLTVQQSLYSASVNAHTNIDVLNSNDALLMVAQAGKATLKTNYNGRVILNDYWKDSPSLNPAIVYADDMYEVPFAERLPLVRYVVVGYRTNPRTTPAREEVLNIMSSASSPTAESPIFIGFSKEIARETFLEEMTNLDSLQFMETRKGIYIENVVKRDPSKPFGIVGTGIPLSPVEQTYFILINQSGTENEEISNPLINGSTYRTVPNYRGEYLTKTRDLYTIKYRGDPSIEYLDIIRVELPYYGLSECIVLESTFVFENGFSGTLKVRRIDNPFDSQIIPEDLTDSLPEQDTDPGAAL